MATPALPFPSLPAASPAQLRAFLRMLGRKPLGVTTLGAIQSKNYSRWFRPTTDVPVPAMVFNEAVRQGYAAHVPDSAGSFGPVFTLTDAGRAHLGA